MADDDVDESQSPIERRERQQLQRHKLTFAVGLLFGLVAGFASRTHSLNLGASFFAMTALSWIASGAFALAAQRHMFGQLRGVGFGGNVRLSPSGRSPLGAAVVGGFLVLLGLAVLGAAARTLFFV